MSARRGAGAPTGRAPPPPSQRAAPALPGGGRHAGRALRRAARRVRGASRRSGAGRGRARPAGRGSGGPGPCHARRERCLLEMETLDHSANMASPRRGCPSRAGACSAPCCAGGWRRPGSPRPPPASPAPPTVPAPAPPASSTALPAGWSARGPASLPPPRRCEYGGARRARGGRRRRGRPALSFVLRYFPARCFLRWAGTAMGRVTAGTNMETR